MKKNRYLILAIASVLSIAYLLTNKLENPEIVSSEIFKLREQHANYLENSPFKKTLNLSKKERKANGIPPNKYFERQWELTMDPSTGKPHPERLFALQESLQKNNIANKNPGSAAWNNWEERGPTNVGGRTRAIMFDPNDVGVDAKDYSKVFAGGVSGGLWVNDDITDESSSWSEVNIPQNLAISVITYDPINKNIFYAGTGESYVSGAVNGDGLWQSTDGGVSWAKIFGGITGETIFKTKIKLTVNSPNIVAGDYQVISAAFGPNITSIITYQIEVAENSAFTQGKQTFNGTSLTQLVPLLEDVAFYWRVKATDSENASSSYSSVYKFYTYGEGIENHLPFSPELIAPELNSLVVGTSAILQWTANDVDTADVLTYDVYLGTDDGNLPLVSADLSATSFITPTLTASETYYWRVEVKDGAGGQTIGQTWSFITD